MNVRKQRLKGAYKRENKEINEQFGGDKCACGNRKVFLEEVAKVNEGNVENFGRVKEGIRKRKKSKDWTWKDYFQALYNMSTQEQVVIHMCGSGGVRRSNYFR